MYSSIPVSSSELVRLGPPGRIFPTGVQSILEAGNEWVRIVVLDRGTGITPENLTNIFKPFVSTKGSKGTGLGLPVSRKILQEHGGDVVVTTSPKNGTTFTLQIPIRRE